MKRSFLLFLSTCTSLSTIAQIHFIPIDESHTINYAYVTDNCNCMLTGNFNYDDEPDSLFAVSSISDSTFKGIIIYYSDGTSTSIGVGENTAVFEIFDKEEREFRDMDNLPLENWCIFDREYISKFTEKNENIPSGAKLTSVNIKSNKIKSDSDYIFLDFGDVFYILCRSEGEWYFINTGV